MLIPADTKSKMNEIANQFKGAVSQVRIKRIDGDQNAVRLYSAIIDVFRHSAHHTSWMGPPGTGKSYLRTRMQQDINPEDLNIALSQKYEWDMQDGPGYKISDLVDYSTESVQPVQEDYTRIMVTVRPGQDQYAGDSSGRKNFTYAVTPVLFFEAFDREGALDGAIDLYFKGGFKTVSMLVPTKIDLKVSDLSELGQQYAEQLLKKANKYSKNTYGSPIYGVVQPTSSTKGWGTEHLWKDLGDLCLVNKFSKVNEVLVQPGTIEELLNNHQALEIAIVALSNIR